MSLLLPPRALLMPYLSFLMAFWLLLVLSCCHHHHHHHHHYFFHHHHNNGNNNGNNNNCPGPNCHRHSNTCANNAQTPPADWAQMPLVEQQKCTGGQLQQLPMPPTMMLINGQQQPAQPVAINPPNRQYNQQQQQQFRWLEQQQQFNTRVAAQQQQQLPKQQMKSGIASATNGPLFRTPTSLSPVVHPTLLPRKPSNNRPGTMQPIKYLKGANSLWLTSTTKKEATKLIAATQPPPPTLPRITNSSRMSVLPAATQPPQQVQAVQAEQSDQQQQEEMDDLPPPPPSRFLPEWEKVRIAELQKKQRQLKNNQNMKGSGDFARRSSTETTTRKVVNQVDTNDIFLRCCRAKRVPQSCESRCNFDALNKKTLTGMFLGRDKCPSEHGIDLLSCAAQDSDHTKCCKENQVQRTRAGDKCFTFCDLNPETMKVTADASYMPCLTVLKEIKTCFQEKILNVLQNKLPT